MILAIICFIVSLIACFFFIGAGYWCYKKNNSINELYAGLWFACVAAIGCLLSGIGIWCR